LFYLAGNKMTKKEESKLEESEFIANQDIDLHYKDGEPCSSEVNSCISIRLKKGNKIPVMFIPTMLEHSRQFIEDMPSKDGLPYLTPEQEKKYGVIFKQKIPEKTLMAQYSIDNLMEKWKKLGADKFKDWAEKEFGADRIDKKKSVRNIISDIRKFVG